MQDSKRDTDLQNGLLDSVGEGEGGMIWENGIETCILSCKEQIASLFDTGYRIQDAWGWCTGMIQRDDMGWEGGSGLGTHVHPWWIHVNVWQNQYSIVKQNKVKNEKRKNGK